MAGFQYNHSRLIDPEEISKYCFTILPVRIHVRDDIANAATLALVRDWNELVQDGREKISHCSLCDKGNWCSFIFPESIPNRLGLLTYLTDIGLIHDDACEEMSMEDAHHEHLDLDAALDLEDTRALAKESKSSKTKSLASYALLECVKIDHQQSIAMLQSYRKQWLSVMEHHDTRTFESLEAFFRARSLNGGMGAYWSMISFSLGVTLTPEDKALMEGVVESAERALLLTNDYYSWERELEQSGIQEDGKFFNVVNFFMEREFIDAESALEKVKQRILFYEAEYLERKENLYKSHVVPSHIKDWLESAGLAVAGNHYWSATCPRHNDWRAAPIQLRTHLSIGDLAAMYPETDGNHDISRSLTSHEASDTSRTSVSQDSGRCDKVEAGADLLDTSAIQAPCDYIRSMPSKGFRSALIEALNIWMQVPPRKLDIITEVIDLLHSSSLMLDDIEDDSSLRRGKPSTHAVFGTSQTINSATYLYTCAVQEATKLDSPESVNIVLDELQTLFVGQSWDLYWKYNLRPPMEKEYFEMVDRKTGGLFRMLVRLMEASSSTGKTARLNLDDFSRKIGRFFQIRDDYMNLVSHTYSQQKGFCEDLDEGKFSYLIVHCLAHDALCGDQIIGLFRSRLLMPDQPLSREAKLHILECLEKTKSMDATLGLLQDLETQIEGAILKLEEDLGEPNFPLQLLLKSLTVKEAILNA
ncbi:geranylgeranyl pyrophosphate synthase [Dendryphion nanum]|uniref:geranylgeranyl diphosphate synthase n=1 Tax=Dendryphion nanum TaxID=256645 RepID=A0A9P9D0Q3_9PLEO|nr:geranylgeranyl pyrophosphate synthase [Dendryphion nanum]